MAGLGSGPYRQIPYRDEQGEIVGVLGLLEDISERKLMEEQRERLAALVDASPDFIGYADPQRPRSVHQQGGRKMCGIGEDEEIGTLTLGDVHPAWMSQQLAEVALPAAVRDGLWQGDGAFLHRDGHEIPVSMAVLAHRGADGEWTSSIRFRATSPSASGRNRPCAASATAHSDTWTPPTSSCSSWIWKGGSCSSIGTGARFWDGPRMNCLAATGSRRAFRSGCGKSSRGSVDSCSAEICRSSRIPSSPSPVRNASSSGATGFSAMTKGHVIGSFSSGTDITERNQAVDALRTAAERMRFALEAAGVGIWDIDFTSGGLHWSETLELQYGLRPGTFGGTFEAFIECIHPDDRASVLETVGKAMKAGADFSVQNRSIWPDGTVRWLSGAGRIYLGARRRTGARRGHFPGRHGAHAGGRDARSPGSNCRLDR